MSKMLFVLTLLLLNSEKALSEQQIKKEDFAFGSEIVITQAKGAIEVQLEDDVFQTVKNPAWLDIAVFNAKGEPVPHVFTAPSFEKIVQTPRSVDVTLFPIYGEVGTMSDFETIKVTTAQGGTIVDIKNSRDKKKSATVIGYLVDASKYDEKIEKLRFSLNGLKENYFVTLISEGSDDLKIWNSLNSEGVLGKFEINSEKLIKDEIDLIGKKYKYYRLSAKGLSEIGKLEGTQAIFAPKTETTEVPRKWKPVTGTKIDEPKNSVAYLYDLGGHFPISALRLKFADQNSMARITIESAESERGPWEHIQTSNFFSIEKTSAVLANLDSEFPEKRARFWRLGLVSNISGVGSRFPEVSFGWRPAKLRFLSRGEAPFTLAYGSGNANNPQQNSLFIGDMLGETGTATLKEKVALGGSEKLVLVEKSEFPTKKVVLWGVLVLGVLLLGSMALQLKKQS